MTLSPIDPEHCDLCAGIARYRDEVRWTAAAVAALTPVVFPARATPGHPLLVEFLSPRVSTTIRREVVAE